ncbi:hypothetical protein FSARC_3384 [Fusarium sarcochroum]|uniref:Rpel repeat protein n=1 Tax=Fusarium sarcochroum TaxID=1208366 RepID=A0A8H4U490_9HYPO|nr:hypothetical protein FSARC_3384 [Fusarium sarcochroum]
MADTTEQQQPQVIDDSSISPIQERRNSLENQLKHRPERSELVETSTAAPGLQAHQKELEKHMLEDKLNDKISHRPDPESLIKKDILHDDPRTVAQDEAAKKYDEAIEDEYAKREGGA